MSVEVQKNQFSLTPKSMVVISLITFILVLIAATAQITYIILNNDKIYKGVYLNDIYVGNMSSQEATDSLVLLYAQKMPKAVLTLKSKTITQEIKLSSLNVEYNIPEAVNAAYSVGRSGNIFQRITEIILSAAKNNYVEMPMTYNKDIINQTINLIDIATWTPVVESKLLIQEDKVTFISGKHGERVNIDILLTEVTNAIKYCKGGVIEIPFVKKSHAKANIDSYMSMINVNAWDASVKVENNEVKFLPHLIGRSIQKTDLEAVIHEAEKNEGITKVLPVTITRPKVTLEELEAKIFKDILATTSSQFSTSNQNELNRTENIKLAIAQINGTVLAPEEIFSFNHIVGPRTEEIGYKEAFTYVGDKVVPGIGGGICQVSSTLYGAALFSDMEVLERMNHVFTVGYVPLGRDAAVAYGQVDFRFKNSSKWPIKIVAWVSPGNIINFNIKGTNEQIGKKVEIYHKTIKTYNFPTRYIDDPTLDVGKETIKQKGGEGYDVETYKIIKQDNTFVSEEKIHTSHYNPLEKIILKGTKAVVPILPESIPQPIS